ncbi:MAG: hypothetical protein WD398_14975 [Cyclobacteriaceae bacterium]
MIRKNTLNALLGVLQTFNGLSGLLGGYMLINDPSGNSLSLKLEWLEKTPFQNYLIPGLVLFLMIGLANVVGLWITFKKDSKRAKFGLVFGLILLVWIISQVAWIGYKDFLQPLYFTSGLLQAISGFALMKLINKT